MQRLVATTGCPTIDAEVAAFADIVLESDDTELVLLRYSRRFRRWYVCGCPSVNAAENGYIPEAQIYWRGIGYVEDAKTCYIIFNDKPLRADWQWNGFYDGVAQQRSRRLARE